MLSPRRLCASAAAALAAAGLLALSSQAQVADPTPPPAEPSDTTTTTALLPVGPEATTTTTTEPPAPAQVPPPTAPVGAGDDPAPDGAPRVVPPEYLPLINSIKRTRGRDTAALVRALQPLVDAGADPDDILRAGFGRFPVGGYANYSDDWWLPRFTPVFHLHEGTDIFAAAGTPVRSPVDGTLRQVTGPVGGTTAYVTEPDGGYVYLAHLSGYPPGQASGQAISAGEIVGYVGDSGNAQGGPPHAHFEFHPRLTGKSPRRSGQGALPAAPPKPYLDRWLDEAVAQVPGLLARLGTDRPRAVAAIAATRAFGADPAVHAGPYGPPDVQLAWASAANPSGGALAIAERAARTAFVEVDWPTMAADHTRRVAEWQEANRIAREILSLVTPPALAQLLEPDFR